MLNNTIMARSPSKKTLSTPIGSPIRSPIESPTEVIQPSIESPTESIESPTEVTPESSAKPSELDILKKRLNEQTYLTKYVHEYNAYLSTIGK